jgi:hypothetical protein
MVAELRPGALRRAFFKPSDGFQACVGVLRRKRPMVGSGSKPIAPAIGARSCSSVNSILKNNLRSPTICATIASSHSENAIAQHRQPSTKFSMRCGSSMTNLNKRCLNSTRSRLGKRVGSRNSRPTRRSRSNLQFLGRVSATGSFASSVSPLKSALSRNQTAR